jgi:hypothetical protein
VSVRGEPEDLQLSTRQPRRVGRQGTLGRLSRRDERRTREIDRELERLANRCHQVSLRCGLHAEGRRAGGECRFDLAWVVARREHHALQLRVHLVRPPETLDHVEFSTPDPVFGEQDVRLVHRDEIKHFPCVRRLRDDSHTCSIE